MDADVVLKVRPARRGGRREGRREERREGLVSALYSLFVPLAGIVDINRLVRQPLRGRVADSSLDILYMDKGLFLEIQKLFASPIL